MPYVDTGQKTTDIGICRRCDFQWVIAEGTKGDKGSHKDTYSGRVCPFCNSTSVRYRKEDNR